MFYASTENIFLTLCDDYGMLSRSNLFFDTELLRSKTKHFIAFFEGFAQHEHCFMAACPICAQHFQDEGLKHTGLALGTRRNNEETEIPVMPSILRGNHEREAIILHLEPEPKNMESSDTNYFSFLSAFQVTTAQLCARTLTDIKCQYKEPRTCTKSLRPEQMLFAKELTAPSTRVPTPIVRVGFLSQRKGQNSCTKNLGLPQARCVSSCRSEVDDLLSYVRYFRAHEMGLWCQGSKEILQRSHCYQKQLLYVVPQLHARRIISFFSDGVTENLKISQNLDQEAKTTAEFSAVFRGAFSMQRFMSKRWNKFSLAVKDKVDDENTRSDRRRKSRIRETINSYDPPKRRLNIACGEVIQMLYVCSQKSGSSFFPRQGRLYETRGQSEEESQSSTSTVDDFMFSHGDIDALGDGTGALGTLLELGDKVPARSEIDVTHPALGTCVSPSLQEKRVRDSSFLDRKATKLQKKNVNDHKRETAEMMLHAPEHLVCASSSLQLAANFLDGKTRSVIYVPPPLSFLASLAVIIKSFLSRPMCDHRVAVVCEPNTGMEEKVSAYLDFTYDGKVSIETARRADFTVRPRFATLANKTARIVVLDSFEFTVPNGFALLVVFAHNSASTTYYAQNHCDSFRGNGSAAVSLWKSIPSVLILPYNSNHTLSSYVKNASFLATMLDVKDAIFVLEQDDVDHLTSLARPGFIFLAPARDALELIAVLEREASSFYSTYERIVAIEQRKEVRPIQRLQDVNVSFLKRYLDENVSQQRTEADRDILEILFGLRQACSYALCDGCCTAFDYLNHYAHQACSKTLQVMQRALEKIRIMGIFGSGSRSYSKEHTMTAALERSFVTMEEEMASHGSSIRSIHRRLHFHPLVITRSKEAHDGLIKSLKRAKHILAAKEGDVGLCELRHLWNHHRNGKSICERETSEASKRFSHVYNVLNERNDEDSTHFLPPLLLQYIHAGRTKLINVVVDETRSLESICERDISLYQKISTVVQTSTARDAHQALPYVANIPINEVLDAFNRVVSPSEKVVGLNTSEVPRMLMDGQTDVSTQVKPQQGSSNRAQVHISASEICFSRVPNIRETLKRKLDGARREENGCILHVYVTVSSRERCTPGTTYIFAAIASDPDLLQYTRVTTELET